MKIRKKELYKTANGETVYSIILNYNAENGVLAELINTGAGIRRISYIGKNGEEKLLTLSYKNVREYETNGSLAGLTIGPNAGRVPAEHGLSANEGKNQLHGGLHNLSGRVWRIEKLSEDRDSCKAVFSAEQPDGLDGWPGNRSYRVSYELSNDGSLAISYFAETDQDTYVNMTNHTYWLMDGASLKLSAEKVCINREDFLPVGIGDISEVVPGYMPGNDVTLSVPLNNGFIISRKNGSEGSDTESCNIGGNDTGKDNIERNDAEGNAPDAILKLFNGKYAVEMYTDAPAIVVYTGDYLDNKAELLDGTLSFPRAALALEAQDMPTVLPKTLTAPDSPFRRVIRFKIQPS